MALINIVLNEDQTEGTQAVLSQWLLDEGRQVEQNQPILELETDKVMMEIVAPVSGILTKQLLQAGDEVQHSQAIGVIDDCVKTASKQTNNKQASLKSTTTEIINQNNPDTCSQMMISPAVRRLLQQHNININQVTGTGKNQRITSRDIDIYLKTNTQKQQLSQHLPISNMRRSIAKHMVDSLMHTAPHVTSVFNLDLTAIIKHRKQYKQEYKKQGARLTFTSYFIAACVKAIAQQPLINSQLHQDSIEVFNNVNIGIGTATPDGGLIVPVLKNCESKDLLSVARDLTQLTNKSRNNALKPNDVKGGTFTISNHGVSGSLIATPIIINQPQSAILGIGKMEKRVVIKEFDGEDLMVIKPMCYVTLTIDHRVLDAQQCNQFLSVFVETLENW